MKDAREGSRKMGRGKSSLLIGLLGLLIFLLLYLLFGRGGKKETMVAGMESKMEQKTPVPSTPLPVGKTPKPPNAQNIEPGKIEVSGPVKTEALKPASPGAPSPLGPPAPKTSSPLPKEQVSSKKEDFTFLKTLKGKEPPAPLRPQEKNFPSPVLEESASKRASKEGSKPSLEKRYTIQVAAMNVEKPAQLLAEKLKGQGFPSYVVRAHRPDAGTIYRVRVGHFSSLPEAKKVARQIHEKEQLAFFITLSGG